MNSKLKEVDTLSELYRLLSKSLESKKKQIPLNFKLLGTQYQDGIVSNFRVVFPDINWSCSCDRSGISWNDHRSLWKDIVSVDNVELDEIGTWKYDVLDKTCNSSSFKGRGWSPVTAPGFFLVALYSSIYKSMGT